MKRSDSLFGWRTTLIATLAALAIVARLEFPLVGCSVVAAGVLITLYQLWMGMLFKSEPTSN